VGRVRGIGLPPAGVRPALVAAVVALSISSAPSTCPAQSPARMPRIGVLSGATPATGAARHEALRQGLRELGYVEGKNVVLEVRYADGRPERLPALASELVRLNVDVVVTSGDHQIRAVRQATQTIPIVVALAGDLVGAGHAASLARPGGNVTGLTTVGPEAAVKRLELLKAGFPKVSRAGLFWNPTNAVNSVILEEIKLSAPAMGVQLISLQVQGPDDLDGAFRAALRDRIDAVMAFGDTVLLTHRARIVDFAAKHRLPAIYGNQDYMDVGGLMFYGPNVAAMYRRAATYVDRILKGARPSDLPIEQPAKLELAINLKTAQALGLTIPQSLLLRADQVIQ
jgi:putative tryptophan/tyrosine transport system substrate-binding protein